MENATYNNNFGISTPQGQIDEHHPSSSYLPLINNASSEDVAKKLIEYLHEENNTQYGQLARLFGTEKNASKNITFTLLTLILVVYVILILWVNEDKEKSQAFVINLFEQLLPLFTLVFGYLFGKQ